MKKQISGFDKLPKMLKEVIWDLLDEKESYRIRIISKEWKKGLENAKSPRLKEKYERANRKSKEYQESRIFYKSFLYSTQILTNQDVDVGLECCYGRVNKWNQIMLSWMCVFVRVYHRNKLNLPSGFFFLFINLLTLIVLLPFLVICLLIELIRLLLFILSCFHFCSVKKKDLCVLRNKRSTLNQLSERERVIGPPYPKHPVMDHSYTEVSYLKFLENLNKKILKKKKKGVDNEILNFGSALSICFFGVSPGYICLKYCK